MSPAMADGAPTSAKSSVDILTLGCRLNSYESEVMRGHAEAAGRIKEGVAEQGVGGRVPGGRHHLQPPRVVPQVPQPEQVLQRHPEIAATVRVLGDKGRPDKDARHRVR